MSNTIQITEKVASGIKVTQFYNKELHLIAEVLDMENGTYSVEYFRIYDGDYRRVGFAENVPNYACGCVRARSYANGKAAS